MIDEKKERLSFMFDAVAWSTDPNVMAMDCASRGLYLELLIQQWINGSIPKDPRKIIKAIDPQKFLTKEDVADVIDLFVDDGEGGLQNLRLEKDRKRLQTYRSKQSDRGKKSAEKRKIEKQRLLNGGSTVVEQALNEAQQGKGKGKGKGKDKEIKERDRENPTPRPSKNPLKNFDHNVIDHVELWSNLFSQKHGDVPEMSPVKDHKIVEQLMAKHGEKKVRERIFLHIESEKMQSITGLKVLFNDLGKTPKKTLSFVEQRAEQEKKDRQALINKYDNGES